MQTNSVTQEIRDDHKRIIGLLRQLEALSHRSPEKKEPVFRHLNMELEVHSQLKEEVLYPVLEILALSELDGLIDVSRDEHRRVLANFDTLKGLLSSEDNSQWRNGFQNVIIEVELLFQREESDILPVVDIHLADRLLELGTWFKARRLELEEQSDYRDAYPKLTQGPVGGAASRKPGVAS